VIGGDGLVKAFQQIEIHDLPLHEIPERTVITSGDLSLWAFEFAPSDYAVGAQAAISKTLAGRRNELRRHPLLDLQVLRFRGMRSEVASALTLANQHIHEMSPPSAELWRELVVIPPLVRRAILHDYKGRKGLINEKSLQNIDVIVRGNLVSVVAPANIEQVLATRKTLPATIEHELGGIAAAFGLMPYVFSGFNRPAESRSERARAKPDLDGGRSEHAHLLLRTARHFKSRGRFPEAIEAATRALQIFESIVDAEELGEIAADTKFLLGELAIAVGQLSEARKHFEDTALAYQRLSHGGAKVLESEFRAAQVTIRQGHFDEALKTLQAHILPHLAALRIRPLEAEALGEIGEVLMAQKKFAEALDVFQHHQLPIYRELKDENSTVMTLGRIAAALVSMGRINDADKVLNSKAMDSWSSL